MNFTVAWTHYMDNRFFRYDGIVSLVNFLNRIVRINSAVESGNQNLLMKRLGKPRDLLLFKKMWQSTIFGICPSFCGRMSSKSWGLTRRRGDRIGRRGARECQVINTNFDHVVMMKFILVVLMYHYIQISYDVHPIHSQLL